jgi:hypothetical protein
MRASMIRQTSNPADRPAGNFAQSLDADHLVADDGRQIAEPCWILRSSATCRLVLSPMATSLVTLLPPTGRTAVLNGEPSRKRARSIVPAPMSATATPSSRSVSERTVSADASEARDQLVDLDVGGLDALRQVADGGGAGGDDVGLDLEADGAHAERILDALLAVDDEAARQDVEDFAVRWDRDGPGDFEGPVDVLAGDFAHVAAHGNGAARVLALDVLAADADEGAVDLVAGQPLGVVDRSGDGADGLVDVDDDGLRRPLAGTTPLPTIVRLPSRATSPMRAQTLLVPTSIPTSTASRSTRSRPR